MAKTLASRKRSWITADDWWGLFFIWPILVGLLVFQLFPFVFGLTVSLSSWTNFLELPTFVGTENYTSLATDNLPFSFGKSLVNTIFFVATVPFGIGASLGLALLVNQRLRGISFFRALYFLPLVTAIPVIAIVWSAIYQPNFGLANYMLGLVGISGPRWLASPVWFKPAIAIMNIWRGAGWGMIILLAGLQGISADYYEAAIVDGAGRWQRFWSITLPLLTPSLFFVLMMLTIFSFQTFDAIYVLGGARGGPASAGATIVMYVYQRAFVGSQFGTGAAAAYVLFLIILSITLLQFALQKRWVFYDQD